MDIEPNKYIVFKDKNEILERLKKNPPRYVMGVDRLDKECNAFCLMRKFDGKEEVILAKTAKAGIDFEEEVRNLAKYFNAEFVEEK